MKRLALAALLLAAPAAAHDWYPYECCHDNDCAPLPAGAVVERDGGWTVTIRPGSHPQWKADRPAPLVLRVPYDKGRASPDAQFHVCLNPGGELLCFFAHVGGS